MYDACCSLGSVFQCWNGCESTELAGLFDKAEPGGYLFRGAYALHYHFGNPEKILVQGAGNTIWTTDNFGQNWRKLASPGTAVAAAACVKPVHVMLASTRKTK